MDSMHALHLTSAVMSASATTRHASKHARPTQSANSARIYAASSLSLPPLNTQLLQGELYIPVTSSPAQVDRLPRLALSLHSKWIGTGIGATLHTSMRAPHGEQQHFSWQPAAAPAFQARPDTHKRTHTSEITYPGPKVPVPEFYSHHLQPPSMHVMSPPYQHCFKTPPPQPQRPQDQTPSYRCASTPAPCLDSRADLATGQSAAAGVRTAHPAGAVGTSPRMRSGPRDPARHSTPQHPSM